VLAFPLHLLRALPPTSLTLHSSLPAQSAIPQVDSPPAHPFSLSVGPPLLLAGTWCFRPPAGRAHARCPPACRALRGVGIVCTMHHSCEVPHPPAGALIWSTQTPIRMCTLLRGCGPREGEAPHRTICHGSPRPSWTDLLARLHACSLSTGHGRVGGPAYAAVSLRPLPPHPLRCRPSLRCSCELVVTYVVTLVARRLAAQLVERTHSPRRTQPDAWHATCRARQRSKRGRRSALPG
jgi:hypothetical protein